MGKETNSELLAFFRRFDRRVDVIKVAPRLYQLAKRRDILAECCAHMGPTQRGRRAQQTLVDEAEVQRLVESALPYQQRSAWSAKCPSEYRKALNRGIIERCCAHMAPAFQKLKERADKGRSMTNRIEISDAEIEAASRQFAGGARSVWQEKDPRTYHAARRRRPDLLASLIAARKGPRRGLTLKIHPDEVRRLASLCEARGEFSIRFRRAYNAARHYGIFEEVCAHMRPPANPIWRNYIYAYEFEDRHVYVGQTCALLVRHYYHTRKGPVLLHAASLDVPLPFPKVLARDVSIHDVVEAERVAIRQYRDAGWTLLNSSDGGELGFKGTFLRELEGGHNREAFVVLGVSGAGKTWVTQQLGEKIFPVNADGGTYDDLVDRLEAATEQDKMIVIDAHAKKSVRLAREVGRVDLRFVLIEEKADVVKDRLYGRGGRGHDDKRGRDALTAALAMFPVEFTGTSSEVLAWLKIIR